MMKRYLAFKCDYYYPSPGMGDFVGDFASLEDAVAALTVDGKTWVEWKARSKWALVWDSEKRADVWECEMLPTE